MNNQTLQTANSIIFSGDSALNNLNEELKKEPFKNSRFFILVDTNTLEFCLDYVIEKVPVLDGCEVIEIAKGENHKNIQTCELLWKKLIILNAKRSDVFINLGGGVICDLGGFVAATFKRGMQFINIPTTILAQIDASVGGKLGIDFMDLKNMIGMYKEPNFVVVDPFLPQSLPHDEILSGFAEMLKHGLIADDKYWNELKKVDLNQPVWWAPFMNRSLQIKNEVVLSDPTEKGRRKILNFGHTIGHAIESYYLENGNALKHGHAVALGIIGESWLSMQAGMLSNNKFLEIEKIIRSIYPPLKEDRSHFALLCNLMLNDKKNISNKISFTLLNGIGDAIYDQHFSENEIISALEVVYNLHI